MGLAAVFCMRCILVSIYIITKGKCRTWCRRLQGSVIFPSGQCYFPLRHVRLAPGVDFYEATKDVIKAKTIVLLN